MADTSRSQDGHSVVAATPARQGRYGRHVFWVLVASTLLAAIGLLLAWTWKAPDLKAADANRANAQTAASRTLGEPPAPVPPTPATRTP